MPDTDVAAFVALLKPLLEPEQLDQLDGMAASFPDAKSLAKELLQRGWLTAYQANQLLLGKGDQLLLGQHILLERLGEGGMGAVFKAKQRLLDRVVALKLIRKERVANPDSVRRFHREVRAAAQLTHPNIVLAFDADQAGDTHFLVLEYVEGTDLAKWVKEAWAVARRRGLRVHSASSPGPAAFPRQGHDPSRHQAAQSTAGTST